MFVNLFNIMLYNDNNANTRFSLFTLTLLCGFIRLYNASSKKPAKKVSFCVSLFDKVLHPDLACLYVSMWFSLFTVLPQLKSHNYRYRVIECL